MPLPTVGQRRQQQQQRFGTPEQQRGIIDYNQEMRAQREAQAKAEEAKAEAEKVADHVFIKDYTYAMESYIEYKDFSPITNLVKVNQDRLKKMGYDGATMLNLDDEQHLQLLRSKGISQRTINSPEGREKLMNSSIFVYTDAEKNTDLALMPRVLDRVKSEFLPARIIRKSQENFTDLFDYNADQIEQERAELDEQGGGPIPGENGQSLDMLLKRADDRIAALSPDSPEYAREVDYKKRLEREKADLSELVGAEKTETETEIAKDKDERDTTTHLLAGLKETAGLTDSDIDTLKIETDAIKQQVVDGDLSPEEGNRQLVEAARNKSKKELTPTQEVLLDTIMQRLMKEAGVETTPEPAPAPSVKTPPEKTPPEKTSLEKTSPEKTPTGEPKRIRTEAQQAKFYEDLRNEQDSSASELTYKQSDKLTAEQIDNSTMHPSVKKDMKKQASATNPRLMMAKSFSKPVGDNAEERNKQKFIKLNEEAVDTTWDFANNPFVSKQTREEAFDGARTFVKQGQVFLDKPSDNYSPEILKVRRLNQIATDHLEAGFGGLATNYEKLGFVINQYKIGQGFVDKVERKITDIFGHTEDTENNGANIVNALIQARIYDLKHKRQGILTDAKQDQIAASVVEEFLKSPKDAIMRAIPIVRTGISEYETAIATHQDDYAKLQDMEKIMTNKDVMVMLYATAWAASKSEEGRRAIEENVFGTEDEYTIGRFTTVRNRLTNERSSL